MGASMKGNIFLFNFQKKNLIRLELRMVSNDKTPTQNPQERKQFLDAANISSRDSNWICLILMYNFYTTYSSHLRDFTPNSKVTYSDSNKNHIFRIKTYISYE